MIPETLDTPVTTLSRLPVPGCPGYFVDLEGRIWSTKRRKCGSQVYGTLNRDGYRQVSVSLASGHRFSIEAHRLVALTFYGPKPFLNMHTRHLDGNRTNNHPSNLAYGSVSDNALDRRKSRSPGQLERRFRNIRTSQAKSMLRHRLDPAQVSLLLNLSIQDVMTMKKSSKQPWMSRPFGRRASAEKASN